jgi:hypothetical protein
MGRRDLGRIAARFGWTSTLFALGGMSGVVTAGALGKAAAQEAAGRKPAKHTLKFGASGFKEKTSSSRSRGSVSSPATLRTAPTARSELSSSAPI